LKNSEKDKMQAVNVRFASHKQSTSGATAALTPQERQCGIERKYSATKVLKPLISLCAEIQAFLNTEAQRTLSLPSASLAGFTESRCASNSVKIRSIFFSSA